MAVHTHTSDKDEWARDRSWGSRNLTPLAILAGRQREKWGVSSPPPWAITWEDMILAGLAMMGPTIWKWMQEKEASSGGDRDSVLAVFQPPHPSGRI